MSLEIQRVDPVHNYELFDRAYEWLRGSPIWRQQTEDVFGTLSRDEYLMAAHEERRADVAIWCNGQYIAKVALHLTAKHTYEVSLEAARGTDPEVIVAAGLAIRDQLFGNYHAELVYAWVPRWAGGVKAILTSIGFTPDCVTMARGTARGRLVEWERYSLRKADEQQEQTAVHPDAESGV